MAQINKPNTHFNTVLYTGNGSTNSITGVGFQPDWIWTKSRSAVYDHFSTDLILRGDGTYLRSSTTNAEASGVFSSLDSDGFTISGNSGNNTSSTTEVSWNWKASGTTSSNTNGSITSTVSANTTAGFSIVSWTGTGSAATIGHGLNSAPEMIIVKNRSKASQFAVYHKNVGATKYLAINDTDAEATYSGYWNDTAPTSSVFSVGSDGDTSGGSAEKVIAYCFHSVKGYSKFGSYTGNGNANGPFVYCGFKPAFIIVRKADGIEDWAFFDNKRDPFNGNYHLLYHRTAAEYTGTTNRNDFYSNGFKLRTTDNKENASGARYIYMAFAAETLVGTNNIPATAR